jgi:hypothetical protein
VKLKAVSPRERAEPDVDKAIDYYLSENAPQAAFGFIDALEQAYNYVGRHPETGSSRYGFSTWSGAITLMSGASFTACSTFLRGCKTLI